MHVFGLHVLDLAIVVASLAAVLYIGFRSSRGMKGESDFFVGGRTLGPFLQFFLNFGQMTDSNSAPTLAAEVYRQGVGGMWIGFQTLFLTPFYWFAAVWFRRVRLITAADIFVDRFDSRKLATCYAAFSIVTSILTLGVGNVISYKVAAAMIVKPEAAYTDADRRAVAGFHEYQGLRARFTAGALAPESRDRFQVLDAMNSRGELKSAIPYFKPVPFYLGYTAVVASYVMMGGIRAAAITDAFQGILIIVFSVLLIPVGLSAVGGAAGLRAKVPEYNFHLFGSSSAGEYTWYSVFAIIFTSVVTIGTPANPAGNASARDERSSRFGMISGGFAKRFIMIAWMYCGLIAAALFGRGIADSDNTWGALSSRLLGPGLMGMMISGMLLGHMPAVGAAAVNLSALLTRNLYEPLFPDRSQRHYLAVAKGSIVLVLALSVVVAVSSSGVVSLLTTRITLDAFFGVVGLLIYYWRGITARAVGVGLAVWVLLMVVAAWALPQVPAFRRLPALTLQTPPRTVQVLAPATAEDVKAGRASREGQAVRKPKVFPPAAVFFESVARVDPQDPHSPTEGIGRFGVESFLLYCLGVPVGRFSSAALLTIRWLFDGLFPFAIVIGLSYATARRRAHRGTGRGAGWSAPRPALVEGDGNGRGSDREPAVPFQTGAGPEGTAFTTVANAPMPAAAPGLPHSVPQSADEERIRIDRFYAKMKTPVAATPEADAEEVALSFRHPHRFDHLKLFPRTGWEFTRWTRADVAGFFGCWAGVGLVLALLWFVVSVGG